PGAAPRRGAGRAGRPGAVDRPDRLLAVRRRRHRPLAGGQQLDGDGDGTAGDDYFFGDAQGLFCFYGDATGDRRVDVADLGLFAGTYLKTSGQTGYLAYFDFNND